MALSLITGGSGAGKTEYIYKKVIDWSMKEPQRQFFVIVPEQSTMQGQKDIVRLHPRRGTMNIDIVSFERLAYRIFGELSLPQPEILDDTGKTMVLRKLAGEQKDQLLLFSAHLNQTGFIDEIKSMLSEFYQYGVTPEALKEQMEKGDMGQVLQGKLTDMNVIYRAFQAFMRERYITAEELLDVLGLRGREKYLPNQLSGGQQQRVSIGRALMNAPAVVLADEPTGNLDSKNSQEIVELLKMSNKKYGQTLVIITHDENIALQAHRVIAIEDGRITRDERIREVLE